jgi:hypothetical protein
MKNMLLKAANKAAHRDAPPRTLCALLVAHGLKRYVRERYKSMRVIFFAFLLLPNISIAGCGWVLWKESSDVRFDNKPTLPRQTNIVDGYATVKDCKNSIRDRIQKTKNFVKKSAEYFRKENIVYKFSEGGYTKTRYKDAANKKYINISSTSYMCLPDTVNPKK